MTWISQGQRLLAGVLERLSRDEVAVHCDVDPTTVSRWRGGSRKPEYAERKALAREPTRIPMDAWDQPAQETGERAGEQAA